MAAVWAFDFLTEWLKENPQPMNEHGQMVGGLPDAFLRAVHIETKVRQLREELEAMSFEELFKVSGPSFDDIYAQWQKVEQRKAFAAGATEARRRDADARKIERHCLDLKSRGLWVRGSAKEVADYFGCSVRHVQNIFSKLKN